MSQYQLVISKLFFFTLHVMYLLNYIQFFSYNFNIKLNIILKIQITLTLP